MPRSAVWAGTPSIRGQNEFVRMLLLTTALVGIQFTWGIEMTYCTPYLLQLGLTKSKTSLVWVAGPLSGMIMAPIVGALADKSKSRWGRRRPFILGGAIIVSLGLFVLGWAKEIAEFFLGVEGASGTPTIALAVFSIYALDFAINAVQWSVRSLIIDTLPVTKQQQGSAWGSRMGGAGQLVVYGSGALDLHAIFGNWLGETQFKKLIIIAVVMLLSCVSITSWAVTERVRISDGDDVKPGGVIAILTDIYQTVFHLPKRIRAICFVQFWAWIGWFPFMFYSATWVGETYFRYDAAGQDHSKKDMVSEIGRIGSTSLIIFSIVTFTASISSPWLVRTPEEEEERHAPRLPPSLAPIAEKQPMSFRKPSLITAWFYSHFIVVVVMGLAPFVTSVRMATVLVAVCGLPWAVAAWAPMTYMGIEINRLGHSHKIREGPGRRKSNGAYELGVGLLDDSPAEDATSGVYLGILNIFNTIPQFIGTLISLVVFSIFEPGQGTDAMKKGQPADGYNGISICLFIGAICAIMAAYATNNLRRLL